MQSPHVLAPHADTARFLEFRPDYGAESPLWEVGGMIWPDSLPLSAELVRDLTTWATTAADSCNDQAVIAEGRTIWSSVVAELGPDYLVHSNWFDDTA